MNECTRSTVSKEMQSERSHAAAVSWFRTLTPVVDGNNRNSN
jgi:hypothetical protein